ncbi:ADP-ribosylglycohydrolase family protein [Cereibacter sphaeroides]|uniref:ADP-ribosylglycohydrolase family protein n=1 Tax=Cereibacter sphaeroides TaxID=1063 RepID=UPI001F3EF092|nr:ADP-ribosylglycohydrolase family protein [Cereibacter sphaeroides]MCE6949934.1 ADP-ribosylglycohydrolase family protein [Cereibacter sphaeroides]
MLWPQPQRTAKSASPTCEGETARAIASAIAAPREGRPETVERLGGGWVADEALAIALNVCLAAGGFEEGLRLAVTHSGDSDSTGAIAGTLLGLLHPKAAMTHRWREQVECADLIDRLARDLAAARSLGEDFVQTMWERYPGW